MDMNMAIGSPRPTSRWLLPAGMKMPDFIICGAMKSGTSTLHYILNQHPRVFIPDEEVHFFDMDNILQHPDFNHFDGRDWIVPDIEQQPERFHAWYASRFSGAADGQVLGEDSTTYLSSETAARRIHSQHRATKLIISLRHPTDRAYSQYWHKVRAGRTAYTFEDSLRYDAYGMLYRSLYTQQLKAFLASVPGHQVKIVLFEEFMADKRAVLRELCQFIGVDPAQLPDDAIDAHVNQSLVSRFPSVELAKNRLFHRMCPNDRSRLPGTTGTPRSGKARVARLVYRAHCRLNPPVRKPPKMKPATRRFLDSFFREELAGLNEVVGRDVLSVWFGEQRTREASLAHRPPVQLSQAQAG